MGLQRFCLYLQDRLTCSLVSESGSFTGPGGVRYFGVDGDACIVFVNTNLVSDTSDTQEYTVSNSHLLF